MDEEPNEHELEERLYAMLHYVDETQPNVDNANQNTIIKFVENAPRSTFRRYWRTSGDHPTNPQTVKNTPKENSQSQNVTNSTTSNKNNNNNNIDMNQKPKEEKRGTPELSTVDLSIFQSSPQIIKKTVEILETENQTMLLESSDEDEVVEIELPPKPTITIESSDEDEVCIIDKQDNKAQTVTDNNIVNTGNREVTASPVPSVVSSVSDEFIRSDCIALNISSKNQGNHSFDFSLHGSDLLGQVTPSKKKKKNKSKESVTSTPINTTQEKSVKTNSPSTAETCFATPKSKAKNKKQKSKTYVVSDISVPNADVYDSDSNQSVIDTNKNQVAYSVTEKSFPNTDVYESDSSQSEICNKSKTDNVMGSSDSLISLDLSEIESHIMNNSDCSIVDLTDSDNFITLDNTGITESIVMGNVTGFQESEDYGDDPMLHGDSAPKLGSTKVPQILFENLDFDNLKGKEKVCKGRKYSLTTLRAEMEKFYNESWGGEDFNHREIQKYMSRDKNLWLIDPKDRMPTLSKRKATCNYCNRSGHRDDACRMKPPVCYMCGSTGHYEPRCPSKICVNCGSPNHMYSSMCRNCAWWARLTCPECGQRGHPHTHCPDLWRRYHNTIDTNTPLVENRQTKKNHQLHCSGCTRRGHLVHTCRVTLPFSGLPINSPYVALYRPIYVSDPQNQERNQQDITITSVNTPRSESNKRQSKSPAMHEKYPNKKKHMSITEVPEENPKSDNSRQRKNSVGKNSTDNAAKLETVQQQIVEPAPDYIPLMSSANHDKKGHMIQDNEVSDTSDVITSARIYVTNDVIEKINSQDGEKWLKETTEKLNVSVENSGVNLVLSIKGKAADQEAFQTELREWLRSSPRNDTTQLMRPDVHGDGAQENYQDIMLLTDNIPKKRFVLLQKLSQALESLKDDLGDPEAIYKELSYLQNRHEQLLKQKVVSPKQLSNNKQKINCMFKTLNMVLLGQVGLAEGRDHLHKLYSLHDKIANARQKFIPLDVRREVGQHYRTIFTPVPRSDYAELLKKYRGTRNPKMLYKKNKVQFNANKKKKTMLNKNFVQPAPVKPVQQAIAPIAVSSNDRFNFGKGIAMMPPQIMLPVDVYRKFAFYRKRIGNSCPSGGDLRKERMDLLKKLHSYLVMLRKNEKISSKSAKKLTKIQTRAEMFLSNI